MACKKSNDFDENSESVSSKDERNPFSFKKFINNPNKTSSDLNNQESNNKNNRSNSKTSLAAEQVVSSNSSSTSDKTNPFSFKNFIPTPTPTSTSSQNNLTCDVHSIPSPGPTNFLPSPPDFYLKSANNSVNECPALPDFLNDSLLSNTLGDHRERKSSVVKIAQMLPSYIDPGTDGSDDEDTGASSAEVIREQRERIVQLEKKIKKLKMNEANENKALEAIIQQVEENLVKTTKRAVESERNADKMKIELKQLKNQISYLHSENQMLKKNNSTGKEDGSGVVEGKKLHEFADQLNGAAAHAEGSLKQLLTGCDTLRLLAASLESYEKIREINESTTS